MIFKTEFTKVKNKDKHVNAVDYYYYVKDINGKDYLFTDSALTEAANRAEKNQEDIPVKIHKTKPRDMLSQFISTNLKNDQYKVSLSKYKYTAYYLLFANIIQLGYIIYENYLK